jgi:hypothetical protein
MTGGNQAVVIRNGSEACILKGVGSTYELVRRGIGKGQSLAECIRGHDLARRSIWKSWPRKNVSCCRSPIPIAPICI